jgi:threonine/homoserine/homoserine lactone efflux protein
VLIGFSIAAPVGPIGVLCIRRTLASGWLTGLVTGLGAATADACYGLLAASGLTLASVFLVQQQARLSLLGGLFLCFLGVRTLLSRPAEAAAQVNRTGGGLLGAYLSTFFLTLTNPMTILSFVAIFAGLGLAGSRGSSLSAGLLVAGVFAGSACWWLLLSAGVSRLSTRLTPASLLWVNRAAGLIIFAFGLVAVVRGIKL